MESDDEDEEEEEKIADKDAYIKEIQADFLAALEEIKVRGKTIKSLKSQLQTTTDERYKAANEVKQVWPDHNDLKVKLEE